MSSATDASTEFFTALLQQRKALREANLAPSLRNEPRELKSDLKKGTSFAKKLRAYGSEHESTIMTELKTYNLKMFVKETAQGVGAALFEAPKVMKTVDVVSLTLVCSALHQRYEEFLPEALQSIKKGFEMAPLLCEMEKKFDPTVPHADVSRLRMVIRFLCEWWLVGLLPDAKFLVGVLHKIAATLEKAPPSTSAASGEGSAAPVSAHVTVNCLGIVNLIIKTVGIEMMGAATNTPLLIAGAEANTLSWSEADEKVVAIEETARQHLQAQSQQRRNDVLVQTNAFSTDTERNEFAKRIATICDHSTSLCARLKKGVEGKWRNMCEQAELRGDPTQEAKTAFHQLRKEVERIYVLTENLVTLVGKSATLPPPLDLNAALVKSQVDAQLTFTSGTADFFSVAIAETMNYYDDDEQRTFYEELPTIDHLIPAMEDDGKGIPQTQQQLAKKPASGSAADALQFMDEEESTTALDGLTRGSNALPAAQRKLMDYSKVDELLVLLHRCSSAGTIDQWVLDFIAEATKYFFPDKLPEGVERVRPAHARLYFLYCKMMLLVELRYEPERAQELIPYLARAAAIMHSRFPELGEALARQLENHVQDSVRNKRPNSYHARLLNTRYLCELVKFRVSPPIRIIRVFHLAMESFEDESCVMMCSIMVERVVSFLLRGGVTKTKAEECLVKLKAAAANKGVPTRAEMDYEHAWAELRRVMNPAATRKVYARVRTPLELYVGHLLYVRLKDDDESALFVRRQLLKMPWRRDSFPPSFDMIERRETHHMLIRMFRKAHKLSYDKVHLLAEMIASITRVHGADVLLQPVVDHLLEDIRRDLEVGDGHRTMQKRLQDMKFIAELYNFKLIPFRTIAYVASMLLVYVPSQASSGLKSAQARNAILSIPVGTPISKGGAVPPSDYSRLRCALMLLRQSAKYFLHSGKASLKQMTRYLLSLMFVHVHTRKKPLPLDLDYTLEETLREVSTYYDDESRRRNRREKKRGGGRSRAGEDGTDADGMNGSSFFIRNFPKTYREALEYEAQVHSEQVHSDNAYFFEVVDALSTCDSQRLFPVLSTSMGGALAQTRQGLSRSSKPIAVPLESKRRPAAAATPAEDDCSSSDSSDDSEEAGRQRGEGDGSSGSDSDVSSEGDSSSGDDGSSDDSGSNSSSSGTSGSSSDSDEDSSDEGESEEDEEPENRFAPKLGPLANAHLLNQRGAPSGRGNTTTNEEDIEFDNMFRDIMKESSTEGIKRTANKSSQQLEKMIESRLTSISVSSVAKQATETDTAIRILASHHRLVSDESTRSRKKPAESDAVVSSGDVAPPAAAASGVRVTVLRRGGVPAQSASSGGSSGAPATRAVEARCLYIPTDSEFAQRSQAFVEQTQRDRALVQERTLTLARQHEAEEAALHWPRGRGGRGGRGRY